MDTTLSQSTTNITPYEDILQYRLQKFAIKQAAITKDQIELFRLEKEDITPIQAIWQYLQSQVPEAGVTSTWEWVSTWIEHYGEVVDYCFIVGMYDGKPCGITVVTRETNRKLPIPVKAFHIGTSGEPYQDQVQMINNQILATEKTRIAFYEALIDAVTTHFPWDEIVFDDYNSNDAELVQKLLKNNAYRLSVEPKSCKYFDFSIPREKENTVLSNLSSDTRYWIKRSLKLLGDDLMIEWADNVEQALDIFDEIGYLFQQKWTRHGQRGIFASKRYISFHQTLISKLLPQDRVILFRVTSKEYGTVGCLYMFIDNGVAYGYQIGLQDFTRMSFGSVNPNRIKAGFILHTMCMQECMNRGLKAYNFNIGDYAYKKELTNAEDEVTTVSVRQSIAPYIRDGAIKLHYKIMHNKSASMLLRPLKMLLM